MKKFCKRVCSWVAGSLRETYPRKRTMLTRRWLPPIGHRRRRGHSRNSAQYASKPSRSQAATPASEAADMRLEFQQQQQPGNRTISAPTSPAKTRDSILQRVQSLTDAAKEKASSISNDIKCEYTSRSSVVVRTIIIIIVYAPMSSMSPRLGRVARIMKGGEG